MRSVYVTIILVFAAFFTWFGIWAFRTGGTRRLWSVTGLAVLGLALLAVFDWYRLERSETPFHTYALLVTIPAVLSAAVIQWMARRKGTFVSQGLAGVATYLAASLAALLSGYYP